MSIENETSLVTIGSFVLRVRPPKTAEASRLMVLIHGWTGDENVMWVFTNRLPGNYWLIAPRGIYPTPECGYGWLPPPAGVDAGINQYLPAIEQLYTTLVAWSKTSGVDSTQPDLMGFSQGAALSFAMTILHPEHVGRTAGLSGFVPLGADAYLKDRPLTGKEIFIAHGSADETVPVSYAHQAVELFERAGAHTTYCEAEVGHKLSIHCLQALRTFFAE